LLHLIRLLEQRHHLISLGGDLIIVVPAVVAPSGSNGTAACMINLLILLSCVCFVAETLPAWEHNPIWFYAESTFIIFFSAELLLRLWSFPGGFWQFWSDPLNVIDLLAVLPFYVILATGWSLHDTRFLRIVRLVRIFKIGRYYTPLMLILQTFVRAAGGLFLCFFFIAAGVVFFSSILWYLERGEWNTERECYVRDLCTTADRGVFDEKRGCFVYTDPVCSPFQSIPTAFWWAIATMTTVGYGDTYPVTPRGRMAAGVAMITGIVCVALPTTILAVEFADKYAKLMNEKQQAEEIRQSTLLEGEEMEIYEDFKKLAVMQKRLDEILPRLEFLVANQAAGSFEDEPIAAFPDMELMFTDAYEVVRKVGGRAQKNLRDYRESVQHFIPTFCPMT